MNSITMKLNADHLIQQALAEDITSEDITTNAVMPDACPGEVELICKQVLQHTHLFYMILKIYLFHLHRINPFLLQLTISVFL